VLWNGKIRSIFHCHFVFCRIAGIYWSSLNQIPVLIFNLSLRTRPFLLKLKAIFFFEFVGKLLKPLDTVSTFNFLKSLNIFFLKNNRKMESILKKQLTFPFLSLWTFWILVVIPLSVYLKLKDGCHSGQLFSLTAPYFLYYYWSFRRRGIGSPFISSFDNWIYGIKGIS